jgi:hypothetical protein
MKIVGQISGGLSSWVAAKRMLAKYPDAEHVLLFADTKIEDEDLYRFLDDVGRDLEMPITRIADGRTPWEVFRDHRFLGNSRVDPCSKVLKRDLLQKWMAERCDPATTLVYTGLGWWEEYRQIELAERKAKIGWTYVAPLCEPPLITHPMMEEMAEAAGIAVPRLYKLGFKHNNCGGGCVKAGIGQFAHLYKVLPQVFDKWEREELRMRIFLGKNVAILEDRRGGTRKPMPLYKLRARLEGREEPLEPTEINDVRGCGCAIDYDPAEEQEITV